MEGMTAKNVCVEKPEVGRPLERPERRWENNIKMNCRERGWDGIGFGNGIENVSHVSAKTTLRIGGHCTRIFNWPNPSSCTMALGSTQPLTYMSTRNIPGG
jgi:hypothetical protein